MIEIYTDGLCEPNPGHACWAWLAKIDGHIVASDYGYLGAGKTNNDAEYVAIGKALRWLTEDAERQSWQVTVRSDSQLVVFQVSGRYACNAEHLRKYRDRVKEILVALPDVSLEWISSKENSEADQLTRHAYREALGKEPPKRH